ncbi:MAG: hypothetical protein U5K31_07745 [Balneolaceae bacterium]|nr:hypothetical protein [Balneolaceae bacterium]
MNVWVFIIVMVAIVGGLITEYQKNKMNMLERSEHNEEEVDELRKLVENLKTRIENLEAIAAGEPDDFKVGAGKGMKEIEIEQSDIREENRKQVSDLANKQRS